jgi:hypothetical protein
LPRRNISAARKRRRSSASKSRRGRAGGLVLPFLPRGFGEVRTTTSYYACVITSLYYRNLFNLRSCLVGLTAVVLLVEKPLNS